MNNEQELNQGADDGGLSNLPEAERNETKAILDEIEAAAPKDPVKKEEPPAPKPEDDKKPEADKKVDGDKKPEGEKPPAEDKKPEARREPKMMPSWQHERAKAAWEREKKELTAKVESAAGKPQVNEPGKPDEKAASDLDPKEIQAIAEEVGVEVKTVEKLLALANKNGGKIPQEVMDKLEKVDKLSAEREAEVETIQYNADFDRLITPLIKAEYGDDVSPDVIADIRNTLKGLAYSDDFAKVAYATLYRGEEQFRNLVPPKAKGAEGSRGGTVAADEARKAATPAGLDLTKPLSDEQIKQLSDADFDTYCKNMESKTAK